MSAGVGYSLGPLSSDQIDFIHSLPVSVLLAAVNGYVDLNRLALQELANRGYDRQGRWIGFVSAKAEYLAQVAAELPMIDVRG